MWGVQQLSHRELSCMSACKLLAVELIFGSKNCCLKPVEILRLQTTLAHDALWRGCIPDNHYPLQHCQQPFLYSLQSPHWFTNNLPLCLLGILVAFDIQVAGALFRTMNGVRVTGMYWKNKLCAMSRQFWHGMHTVLVWQEVFVETTWSLSRGFLVLFAWSTHKKYLVLLAT